MTRVCATAASSASSASALSSDLDQNRGTVIGAFGIFGVGGAAPSTLSCNGSRLSYDLTLGDLLMDVSITNAVNDDARYGVFYNADYNGSDTLRAFTNRDGTYSATTGGLVTTFSLAGGVLEPATWALMILGFGAVGGAMRRRQAVTAKVRFA